MSLQKRKSLKIVVSSATVDAEQLRDFFNMNSTKDSSKDTAVIMSVEGRLYPVDIFYVRGRTNLITSLNLKHFVFLEIFVSSRFRLFYL